ncbi:endonuclease MutS2 [Anoxybacillus flavithermus]|uniref:Endonuclease MutS2 n=1 Tax=Anoxybacillus flavithermus AK1 TaxID=1297581 RepID=M8D6F3_9BACL|nr:endonuclease MutS2 [Anoxybacillus flavithermus]EMT46416.1 recombination and DNA strand exchange inhibitor protein [Anoxybacillus flavithermus AK1]
MHLKTLHIVEFDKVKAQLASHVSSSLGKEKVEALKPSSRFEEVVRWQEETDEAATVLRLRGHVPLGGIFDVRPQTKRARIGGVLSPHELLDVASTMRAARQLKKFVEGTEAELTYMMAYAEQIVPLIELEQHIYRCIDEGGEILDGASDRLRSLRQQLRAIEGRVRDKLESIIRSSSAQKTLSDAIITIRNDRYVIPVKQEYRHTYGGIVHDQSSSGATLFIEPQSVVELNNELQQLRMKEKQEVERILSELSAFVGELATTIMENVEVLAQLDFLFAKAKYAKAIKATKPTMNERGYIRLIQARHPLISPDQVVPNDIELGSDYTTMVITGPNTGGKTVTLKTIGLFTIMAQAGLHVPALDGSQLAVFRAVYADIGDEQSIEQSLSTFSSHMVNIVDILKQVDEHSLVLFDELGAGTDPQEGAALAIAILDEVHNLGARVVATTHYPELKAYGYNRRGVMNASVEFDIETLSPTYKLLIGIPGRSNALDISRRLGLDEHIIARARTYISAESNEVENMIASLEQSKKRAEEEWEKAERLRHEAEQLRNELERQWNELNEQRDRLLEKAKEQAEEIVKKAMKTADEVIQHLRDMQKQQAAVLKEHELIHARKKLEEAIPQLNIKKKKTVQKLNHPLHLGDEVKVIHLNQKGQLIEKVSDKEWIVQIGILKMKVHEENLQYVSSPTPIETKPVATIKGRDHYVPLELDLRGERYEDALLRVEKYIDDAVLAGYPRVSIIHGKGTGALRKGVQQYLQNHRSVKSIRFGEATEGGTGVTIVELK